METPYSGRTTINESYKGIELIIPAKKNWPVILFMCVWMIGWAFGEFFATKAMSGGYETNGSRSFMILWLTGWTFGGVFIGQRLVQYFIGKEIITFTHGEVTIARKGSLFSRTKTYDLNEAKDFRAVQPVVARDIFGFPKPAITLSQNAGTIWFDYGMKTVRFGNDIDEAEAKAILKRLQDKKILKEVNFHKS
jgi:hypothetical protein